MGKEHRLAQRRRYILEAIEKAGELSVIELSDRFDVSEVTIRQDLQALSEQGLILRTRGRALATAVMPEFSYDVRQQQHVSQKIRIGRAAASLIHPGDTIILDASTTANAVIPFVKSFSELTVITNGLKTAMNLLDSPQIQVIMTGGNLRRPSISLVGQPDDSILKYIHVRIGFFGARGVTLAEGLTDVGLDEVVMKRMMVERCQQVVGVVDSRKWGQVATGTFAELSQIDTLITDDQSPDDLICQIRRQEVEVVVV